MVFELETELILHHVSYPIQQLFHACILPPGCWITTCCLLIIVGTFISWVGQGTNRAVVGKFRIAWTIWILVQFFGEILKADSGIFLLHQKLPDHRSSAVAVHQRSLLHWWELLLK